MLFDVSLYTIIFFQISFKTARRRAQKERNKKNAKDFQGQEMNYEDSEMFSDTKGKLLITITMFSFEYFHLKMRFLPSTFAENVLNQQGFLLKSGKSRFESCWRTEKRFR